MDTLTRGVTEEEGSQGVEAGGAAQVAWELLGWPAPPPGLAWLDVGCGTGSRAHVAVGDARALSVAGASFDQAVSGLVLNFVPQPARAITEMARAVRPGGVVAAFVWEYAAGMEMMRAVWDAAAASDPDAAALNEGRRFPLCQPGPLGELLSRAGLGAVDVRPIDIRTDGRNFDNDWSPFRGGQGPAPGYVASLDEPRQVCTIALCIPMYTIARLTAAWRKLRPENTRWRSSMISVPNS